MENMALGSQGGPFESYRYRDSPSREPLQAPRIVGRAAALGRGCQDVEERLHVGERTKARQQGRAKVRNSAKQYTGGTALTW